jgi:hypothetical protein
MKPTRQSLVAFARFSSKIALFALVFLAIFWAADAFA